ncbi:neuropeptide SIFamide receptor-like [Saccostrea cucullata]|uniref:neuropeptide SIFamide receptor-like n=1 Tax=Saccostrea cuccullata TaxID=36930 RepID=UPI002ED4D045
MTSTLSYFVLQNTPQGPGGNASNISVKHLFILKQPMYMIAIYSIAYCVVFLCALFGNLLVVTVVFRYKAMRTVTNCFIVNLAVADILVAVFNLPITLLSNFYLGWPFGPVLCKVTPYLQGVSVCASVNTLAVIAVDRYFAICSPLKYKLDSTKLRKIIICIWMTSCIIIIPWAVFYIEEEYKYTEGIMLNICYEKWPSEMARNGYFLGVIFLCCYTIPLILICICYLGICVRVWNREQLGANRTGNNVIQRSKVKVVKMLAVVVFSFAFSWLPLYIVNMIISFHDTNNNFLHDTIIPFAQWLGSSNSGMNPIIYCFFSRKFRNGFRKLLCPARPSSNTYNFRRTNTPKGGILSESSGNKRSYTFV